MSLPSTKDYDRLPPEEEINEEPFQDEDETEQGNPTNEIEDANENGTADELVERPQEITTGATTITTTITVDDAIGMCETKLLKSATRTRNHSNCQKTLAL